MIASHAWYRRLPVILCCLFLLPAGGAARAQSQPGSSGLIINILQGEGALNDIRQRTAREPIVEVQDSNHKPVAGAAVLFALPSSGPGGTFAGGAQTFTTLTDSTGRAVASGFQPNNVSGKFDIHVHVSYQGSTADTNIHESNTAQGSSSSSSSAQASAAGSEASAATHVAHILSLKAILIIVGAAAAAGTVGAIVATQGGNSTTITAGTPTVGAPAFSGAGFTIPLHRRSH